MRTFAPALSKARLEQLLFPHRFNEVERLPDTNPGSREKSGLIGFAAAPKQAAAGETSHLAEHRE